MNIKKANIKKVYSVSYKSTYIKCENRKIFTFSFMLFLSLFLFSLVLTTSNSNFINVINKNVCKLSNPISYLYNDNSEVVFTGGGSHYENGEISGFIAPVKYSTFKINNGDIFFSVVDNNIVVSPENGIITNIFYNSENLKCVEITHNKFYKTIICNFKYFGCVVNQIVKKGSNLGVCYSNSNVIMQIKRNEEKVLNIFYRNNEFVWQK